MSNSNGNGSKVPDGMVAAMAAAAAAGTQQVKIAVTFPDGCVVEESVGAICSPDIPRIAIAQGLIQRMIASGGLLKPVVAGKDDEFTWTPVKEVKISFPSITVVPGLPLVQLQ